jgi:hypothetical protein
MKINQLKKTERGHRGSNAAVGWQPTSTTITGLRMHETIAAVYDPVYGVEVAVGFVSQQGRLSDRSIAPDSVEGTV